MSSKIEWTGQTWNPVVGCTRVSAGCDNCYAVGMSHRLEAMGIQKYKGLTVPNNNGERHFNGVVRCVDEAMDVPLKRKQSTTYFVNSMSDLFHKDVPLEFIVKIFTVMSLCRHHTFQILTKRPERMAEVMSDVEFRHAVAEEVLNWHCNQIGDDYMVSNSLPVHPLKLAQNLRQVAVTDSGAWPLLNVWLGTSVEDQETADERIPHLLRCPAAVRFLSCEPLLGALDISRALRIEHSDLAGWIHSPHWYTDGPRIDWVIAGGESGSGARPCDVSWIRSIVEQCSAAGVACFVKQVGRRPVLRDKAEWPDGTIFVGLASTSTPYQALIGDRKGGDPDEWPEDLRVREMPVGFGEPKTPLPSPLPGREREQDVADGREVQGVC